MAVKPRFIFIFLFACTVCWCFSQQSRVTRGMTDYKQAVKLFTDADKLTTAANTDTLAEMRQESLDSQALVLFLSVIAEKNIPDSLLFHCYAKTGLLYHYFDSLPQAENYYLKAISLRPQLRGMADSFFFQPYLFAGSICYTRNLFDSALIYYRQAENIAGEYTGPLEESERLYNLMGAMYYESGNYRLANYYFQKALSVLSPRNPSYVNLQIKFKMNIGSIFIKLEEFQKAEVIFRDILRDIPPSGFLTNEINHNLGIIELHYGKYADAVSFFRKVEYDHNPAGIELYYDMALAFSELQQKDSSAFYIHKARAENIVLNGDRKNAAMGLVYKFIGDEKVKAGDLQGAVSSYTSALAESYPAYRDTGVYSEPEKFSGALSFVQLFNILIAKAEAFNKLWDGSKSEKYLEASFKAYLSAFDLADHIAKTYESDEARIFLNKIKYAAHDKAIQTALTLYETTGNKYYLGEAYIFDQQNKASALTMALQENTILKQAGKAGEQEENIRSAITRLLLKASHTTDPRASAALDSSIRDNEIKLAEVQERRSNDPSYAGLRSGIEIPSTEKLQAMLDDETALLSYHLSEDKLLVFCVRRHSFDYVKQQTDSNFYINIGAFIKSLQTQDPSQRYTGAKPAEELYKILIEPVLSKIGNVKRLIIIPDDELNNIPFEALQDEQQHYLLSSYAVQYQFSTALLQLNETRNESGAGVLAFAPFTGNNPNSTLPPLPYSKEEVAGLRGKVLTGEDATKKNFITYANKFRTVQLATHADADDSVPEHSFIAFYPEQKDSAEKNLLFAQEIYGLQLDSINLIILSACETGKGKLVRGEGLMSLTRAFSYAGCPNIITSLWKATDKTTAFITQRLHIYLDKGYTKDRALQLAKTDLLNSNEISPALKTPNYWANLVFIGNYVPAGETHYWYWLIAGILFSAILYFMVKRKFRRNAEL
jgi:CHAT domain-containing protein/tetratricopeptide (TPR) repeat protein